MRPRMKSGGGRLLEVNALSAPFTLQRNAYAELEFSVPAFKFPIPLLNFPDPSRREFIEKDRLFHSVRSSCGRGFRLKSQEFPVFSLFNREPAETGSLRTPCSTTKFYCISICYGVTHARGFPRHCGGVVRDPLAQRPIFARSLAAFARKSLSARFRSQHFLIDVEDWCAAAQVKPGRRRWSSQSGGRSWSRLSR